MSTPVGLARYAVKSATLTFGGNTYEAETAPVMKPETRPAVEVTSLADTVKKFIVGAVTEYDEVVIGIYQKGSSDLSTATTPGQLSIAALLENGVDTDVTVTITYPRAIIVKVEPAGHQASSDRKALYNVTFRPDGTSS